MSLEINEVCDDLRTFFDRLADLNPAPPMSEIKEQEATAS